MSSKIPRNITFITGVRGSHKNSHLQAFVAGCGADPVWRWHVKNLAPDNSGERSIVVVDEVTALLFHKVVLEAIRHPTWQYVVAINLDELSKIDGVLVS